MYRTLNDSDASQVSHSFEKCSKHNFWNFSEYAELFRLKSLRNVIVGDRIACLALKLSILYRSIYTEKKVRKLFKNTFSLFHQQAFSA